MNKHIQSLFCWWLVLQVKLTTSSVRDDLRDAVIDAIGGDPEKLTLITVGFFAPWIWICFHKSRRFLLRRHVLEGLRV